MFHMSNAYLYGLGAIHKRRGGPTPFLPMGKLCLFPFFPMGKKYMEREGNEYFFLFFHILFSPWGKMGERQIFPMGKSGVGPPQDVRKILPIFDPPPPGRPRP